MIARLAGGQTYEGNFDIPEPVLDQVKLEMLRLSREFPGLTFERGETHVHDRGHRLIEFTAVSSRIGVGEVADYLDSLAYYLYADLRGLDSSQWPIKFIEL